jgi:hypothetical protein
VALKVLPELFLHDPELMVRARSTIAGLAIIEHRAHLKPAKYGNGGRICGRVLALELVPGATLASASRAGRCGDARCIARQIVDALDEQASSIAI